MERLADDASGDDGLGSVVVELKAEGKEKMVKIAVQRGEVEAEDVSCGVNRVGLLLCFDGNVAEEAGLGGVGGLGDFAGCLRHGN